MRSLNGKLLVQGANFFFAGATIITDLGILLSAVFSTMPKTGLQWGVLVWLGQGVKMIDTRPAFWSM